MKQAADTFIRYGFRALPATDENGVILGVVPYRDVMNLSIAFSTRLSTLVYINYS
jgi:CBS-domain-containing membrane protein